MGAAAAASATQEGTGLRAWLKTRVDLAQYRPQALPSAVVSHLQDRQGPYVILKNPETKTYYRIGDRDFFLWQKMDGTCTVQELVVAYFMEYKSFAFSRVASLVLGLRQNHLLVDEPAGLYGQVRRQLARRHPQTRLLGLWAAFAGKQFAVGGLDRWFNSMYRWGGRLFYTRPMLILYVLLTLGGLYCFFRAFSLGGYGVVQIAGSYTWGAVGLAVAYLLAILVHETAHALTVKHYGREVRRAGFMIYVGMPGFFVDTTDIWMEGKRARLAVTWAGPYSGLILGGLASIVMVTWPDFVLNAVLFQFAFMTYILVFLNLNPLLALDGYYLLMDSLEIPGLRSKSFDFLRTGVVARLKGRGQAGKSPRAILSSFSREERIFTVFGLLSAAWTAYALFTAARYYQSRIASSVHDLWSQQRGAGQTGIAIVGLLFSLLLGAGLLIGLWSIGSGLLRSAARQGLFRGWRLTILLLVVTLILTFLPGAAGRSAWMPAISLVALAAAAALAVLSAMDLAGSRLAPVFWLLAAVALGLGLKEVAALAVTWHWIRLPLARVMEAGLGLLAVLGLYGAGLALLGDANLKQLSAWERTLLAGGVAAGPALALLMATRLPAPLNLADAQTWLAVARPAAALLFLVVLLPALVSYWRTALAPAWALLVLAGAGLFVAAVLDLLPVLPPLLLAAAAVAFHRASAGRASSQAPLQMTFDLTDVQRLHRAFLATVRCLYEEWSATAGSRGSQALLGEFNNYALAAGWRVQVARGEVEQSLPADLPLARRGEIYAAALTLLLDLMARQVGEKLTVRGLQRAYDSLAWDQREVASAHLFCQVRRAEALSREFESTQQSYRALLRRIPLFATIDEGELDLLCSQLRVEHFPAGRTIIRQGEPGDRFYIVHRGHVEVTQRDEKGVSRVVNQFDRGGYFGEVALLNDAPRNATCRAVVPGELLSLSRPDFERLVKVRFGLKDSVDRSLARAELLRRVPLFADLDAHQIQLIAGKMREECYAAGQEFIRQGEIGETFYVIEAGRVETSVRQDGGQRVIAHRGPGEYVGEIALLMQVPRTATVRALTPVRLLALQRDDFSQLVASHLLLSHGLERDVSRRMLNLRQAVQPA